MKIPLLPNLSKESFSFSAIGKFVGSRPSLESLELGVHKSWPLTKPYLILLTKKGNFIFCFNLPEDRDNLVLQSPIFMDRKKLLLLPWAPGQDESSLIAVTLV